MSATPPVDVAKELSSSSSAVGDCGRGFIHEALCFNGLGDVGGSSSVVVLSAVSGILPTVLSLDLSLYPASSNLLAASADDDDEDGT